MTTTEKMGLCLAFFVLSLIITFSALLLFHTKHPNGDIALNESRRAEMSAAYKRGEYREFIRLYETPLVIRFSADRDYRREMTSHDELFQIANAYREVGNTTAARKHLLRIVGLSSVQYESYCLLTGNDCQTLDTLRMLADTKRMKGTGR